MSDFTVAHDFDPFTANMVRAPAIVREELVRSTDKLTLAGENIAKGIVPVKTGHLRRSIAHKPAVWAGGSVTGTYGTATPYAKYVEFGRGPIVARGRALVFTIGGKTIFAKRVGPAAARPFIRPSVARLRPLVSREYRAAMQRIIARIGVS